MVQRTKRVISIAMLALTLFACCPAIQALAATDGSENYVFADDPDFWTKFTERVSDYTKALFTRIGLTDELRNTQWALDDANIDLVWEQYKSTLDSSTTPIFLMVIDGGGVEIDNPDFKLAALYDISNSKFVSPDIPAYGLGEEVLIPPVWTGSGWLPEEYKIGGITFDNKYLLNIDTQDYTWVYHGTHVAGIAGARHNNSGIAGVDGKSYVIPANRMDQFNEYKTFIYIRDVILPELKLKTGSSKVRLIVNMSFGGLDPASMMQEDYDRIALYNELSNEGVLIIKAAGNTAVDLGTGIFSGNKRIKVISDALSADNVINVTAHGINRVLYDKTAYSSAGSNAIIHLSAPGVNIMSSVGRRRGEAANIYDRWCAMTGTSMAAPMVAGSAALLWRLFPDATGAQIKDLLFKGAMASNQQAVPVHNAIGGSTGTKIGNYVRTGFLDVAQSIKESKNVAGLTAKNITIPVKEIVISTNKAVIDAGGTAQVSVTKLRPYTAENKSYTWVSSNPSILAVDAGGNVQAADVVSADTEVNVYAKANDATATQSNKVAMTVKASAAPAPALNSVSIESSIAPVGGKVTMYVGSTVTLTPVVNPSNVPAEITWSNSGGLQQGTSYVYTGTTAGTKTITVTAASGTASKNASIIVEVKEVPAISVSSVAISGGSANIGIGSSTTLSAVINPANADVEDIQWTVTGNNGNVYENKSVNAITLTGLLPGTVTVTLKVTDRNSNTKTASATVTVVGTDPEETIESVSINSTKAITDGTVNIEAGDTFTLDAVINPAAAPFKKIAWEISGSDGSVERTDAGNSIRLTGKAAGTATVKLSVTDNEGNVKTSTVKVAVKAVTPTPGTDEPSTGGEGGGGGGCNVGIAGLIALLFATPIVARKFAKR